MFRIDSDWLYVSPHGPPVVAVTTQAPFGTAVVVGDVEGGTTVDGPEVGTTVDVGTEVNGSHEYTGRRLASAPELNATLKPELSNEAPGPNEPGIERTTDDALVAASEGFHPESYEWPAGKATVTRTAESVDPVRLFTDRLWLYNVDHGPPVTADTTHCPLGIVVTVDGTEGTTVLGVDGAVDEMHEYVGRAFTSPPGPTATLNPEFVREPPAPMTPATSSARVDAVVADNDGFHPWTYECPVGNDTVTRAPLIAAPLMFRTVNVWLYWSPQGPPVAADTVHAPEVCALTFSPSTIAKPATTSTRLTATANGDLRPATKALTDPKRIATPFLAERNIAVFRRVLTKRPLPTTAGSS